MFTFVSALASLRGANQRLADTDVGNTPVRDLMTTYSQCILILSHPALDHNVSLDVALVADQFLQLSPDLTVNTWLVAIGDNDLPFNNTIPTISKSSALASEAWTAGFDIQRVHPLSGDGNHYPDADLTHLRLTKPGIDYLDMYNYVLASVNGLFHLTDAGDDGFRIIDGGKSIWHSRRNEVGLISFSSVGQVECFPITADMITGRRGLPLSQGAIITAPEADFGNKFVMVVIGGILHTAGHQYRVVGDSSVQIDWWKLPIHRRFFDTYKLIDWSPVFDTMEVNKEHVGSLDLKQMNTDESIKAYLTMSNTFIITVDAPNLFFENLRLERTGLAGRYYSHVRPTLPLLLDNGLMPAYTIHDPNNGMYSLAVDGNNRPSYLHDTRNALEDEQYVNDAKIHHPEKHYTGAHLLDMFTERLTY